MDHNQFGLGHVTGHALSLGAIFGVLTGVLPVLAALGAVIWYIIAIYETQTVQTWLQRRRARKASNVKHDPA